MATPKPTLKKQIIALYQCYICIAAVFVVGLLGAVSSLLIHPMSVICGILSLILGLCFIVAVLQCAEIFRHTAKSMNVTPDQAWLRTYKKHLALLLVLANVFALPTLLPLIPAFVKGLLRALSVAALLIYFIHRTEAYQKVRYTQTILQKLCK